MFSLPLLVVVLFQVRQHRPQPYLLTCACVFFCSRKLIVAYTAPPLPTLTLPPTARRTWRRTWFWEVGGCNPREPRACCRILARCRRLHQRERWRTVVLPCCQKREDCLRKVEVTTTTELYSHTKSLCSQMFGVASQQGWADVFDKVGYVRVLHPLRFLLP